MNELIEYEARRLGLNIPSNFNHLGREHKVDFLMGLKNDNIWDFLNFILVIENFYDKLKYQPKNTIEEKIFNDVSNNLKWFRIKSIQMLFQNHINESHFTEFKYFRDSVDYISINLDSMYSTSIVDLLTIKEDKILPRTKDLFLARRIINVNLIICTLESFDELKKINKTKNEETELGGRLKFTKGFVIMVPKRVGEVFLNFISMRKIVSFTNKKLEIIKVKRVEDSLKNENYTRPVWLKNESILNSWIDSSEIESNILNDTYDAEKTITNLKILNSKKMTHDPDMLDIIMKLGEENLGNLINLSISDGIISIKPTESEDISDSIKGLELQELKNECYYLINLKREYERFGDGFYLSNKNDWRNRTYVWNYPINHQLSHIVRVTIKFKENSIEGELALARLLDLGIWNDIGVKASDCRLFYSSKIDKIKDYVEKLKKIGFKDIDHKEGIYNMKLEGLLINLYSLSPKKIISINDKFDFIMGLVEDFCKTSLNNEEEIMRWLGKTGTSKNKVIYLIRLNVVLKKLIKGDWEELTWTDATANGVCLIGLRMGCFKDEFLQVSHLKTNKTRYAGIYNYTKIKIDEYDHKEFIREVLEDKISLKELLSMNTDSLCKTRVMTAGYGKGVRKSVDDLYTEILDKNIDIMKKIEYKDVKKIAEMFWSVSFSSLEELGYKMEGYKTLCKGLSEKMEEEGKRVCTWYNEGGLPVTPIKFMVTKRSKIREKIEKCKGRLVQDPNNKEIKKELVKIRKDLEEDDKKFNIRTLVKTNNGTMIRIRIPRALKIINGAKTRRGLMPNNIHSYDASLAKNVVEIADSIGINVLTIFDSFGTSTKNIAVVNIIFKLALIKSIEDSFNKERFITGMVSYMSKIERIKVYKDILESDFLIK